MSEAKMADSDRPDQRADDAPPSDPAEARPPAEVEPKTTGLSHQVEGPPPGPGDAEQTEPTGLPASAELPDAAPQPAVPASTAASADRDLGTGAEPPAPGRPVVGADGDDGADRAEQGCAPSADTTSSADGGGVPLPPPAPDPDAPARLAPATSRTQGQPLPAAPGAQPPERAREDTGPKVDHGTEEARSAARPEPVAGVGDNPTAEDVDQPAGAPDRPLDQAPAVGRAAAADDDVAFDGDAVDHDSAVERELVGSDAGEPARPAPSAGRPRRRFTRQSRAALLIGVLFALLGFALAVQVRSNNASNGLASARQEDLVRILDDLSSREERLRGQIASLEAARARLGSTGDRNSAALAEARTRSTALGILAGTIGAQGPGIQLVMTDPQRKLTAEDVLDAVEELRAAGAEAIQVGSVRVGLNTAFTDQDGTILADGAPLSAPYLLLAIGEPATLATALNIPGGVVDTTRQAGGRATIDQQERLVIRALRPLSTPHYAQPADGGGSGGN